MPTTRQQSVAAAAAANEATADDLDTASTSGNNMEAPTTGPEPSEASLPTIERFQPQAIQLIQPIKAPILRSTSRLELTKFNLAYDQYVLSSNAHNVAPRTKVECIDPMLLEVLAIQYVSKPKQEITEADVDQFIRGRLSKGTHFTEESITKLFADIKMNLHEADPVQRVVEYNIRYMEMMEQSGLRNMLHSVPFRKQVVALLLSGVRPSSLRRLMNQKTKVAEAEVTQRCFSNCLKSGHHCKKLFMGKLSELESTMMRSEN